MFTVNGDHISPDIASLHSMVGELQLCPADGEAYLVQECVSEALAAATQGRYGVAAVLSSVREGSRKILHKARNERFTGSTYQFTGHAEMRLVDMATPYLQDTTADHESDLSCVNLCPCPGCFGHMLDAHLSPVLVGSIDPQVGAAFLRGDKLQYAAGMPRKQVMEERKFIYRFPEIADPKLRNLLLSLSWEVFHATRKQVHRAVHGVTLREDGNQ